MPKGLNKKSVTMLIPVELHRALIEHQASLFLKSKWDKKIPLYKLIPMLLAEQLSVDLEEGWDKP